MDVGHQVEPGEVAPKRVFDYYDTDKDGVLNFKELEFLLSSVGELMSSIEVETIFSVMDTDNDGQLSLNDFSVWLKKPEDVGDKVFYLKYKLRCKKFMDRIIGNQANLSTNLYSDVCVTFGECTTPSHEFTLVLDNDGNAATSHRQVLGLSDMDSAISISLTCKENVDEEMLDNFVETIRATLTALELLDDESFLSSLIPNIVTENGRKILRMHTPFNPDIAQTGNDLLEQAGIKIFRLFFQLDSKKMGSRMGLNLNASPMAIAMLEQMELIPEALEPFNCTRMPL
eukprot:TRINITY_DN6505_c0_g1_i1.p1 TRINITY_DN6505_c0_g1~~TRINITY_DN6505_c0_g1_i1.p1  ORF type:complete len:286 (+),score=58.51 TRINITY_DN6505_c0_g1_i1:10-867(+)